MVKNKLNNKDYKLTHFHMDHKLSYWTPPPPSLPPNPPRNNSQVLSPYYEKEKKIAGREATKLLGYEKISAFMPAFKSK